MTQGQLTFDQAILVEGEHTGRLVQTARGKAFPIAAPGNCVHFFGVRYLVSVSSDSSNSDSATPRCIGVPKERGCPPTSMPSIVMRCSSMEWTSVPSMSNKIKRGKILLEEAAALTASSTSVQSLMCNARLDNTCRVPRNCTLYRCALM